MMSIKKLRKEINELKKTKGNDAVPFEILDRFVNGEITCNEALHILDTEKPPFADMQRAIIGSQKDLDDIKEENREYLKDIFRELEDEQQDTKSEK